MCDSSNKIIIYNDREYFLKCFSRFRELKMQQKMCDVTLVFNRERLNAHSIVLASGSDYFFSIFIDDSSKRGSTYSDVELTSVNSTAVFSLVDYLYTGMISLTEENVMNTLSVASLFQLQLVIDECLKFLESSINMKNCLEILKLSKIHSSTSLENRSMIFLQMNFKKVSETEEFLNIDVNNLKELLDNDFLNVSSEDEVFESVNRWVKHEENRNQHVTSLMGYIRLPHISNEVIFDKILPLCGTFSSCVSMALEAIQVKLSTSKKNLLSAKQLEPRRLGHTVLIVGSYNLNRASIAEIYDPLKNKWFQFMDLKLERKNFGVVLLDETFLIIGGYIGARVVKTVESINYLTGEKKSMPALQTARAHVIAIHLGDSVYVAGGRGDSRSVANLTEEEGKDKPISTMERWDINDQKWYYSTPMITPRECYGAAVFDNEFYVVGGWSQGSASDKTEAFCPITGKWRKCASMLVKRNWVGVGSVNGFIYAVGGRSGYNFVSTHYSSVERYDSQSDNWSIVTNFRVPRFALGVGNLGRNMITIGGATNAIVSEVDEYDTEKRTWKRLADLLAPREETVVISVPVALLQHRNN